jgi:hypothetical protein
MTGLGVAGEHHQEGISQEEDAKQRGKRKRLEIISNKEGYLGGVAGWSTRSASLGTIVHP